MQTGELVPLRDYLLLDISTLGGLPISWKTKKLTTVPHSSTEAEYRSMATTTSELMWSKSLLASLGVFYKSTMCLF